MPNILITGTPGTGKTTLAASLARMTGQRHLNVSQLVRDHELYEGRNEEFDAFDLDDDKLVDYLEYDEKIHTSRNCIVDFHTSEVFPERWFDLIVVLRADNNSLFARLKQRGYSDKKIQENLDAEIFQVCLDEAKDSYKPDIVWELQSNSVEDMERNLQLIMEWMKTWTPPADLAPVPPKGERNYADDMDNDDM